MYFEEDVQLLFSNKLLLVIKFLFAGNILIMTSKTLLHAISIATGVAIGVAVTEAVTFRPIERFPEVLRFKPVEKFPGSELEMRSDPLWKVPSVGMVPPILDPVVTVHCSDTIAPCDQEQIESSEENPSNHSSVSKSTESGAETTLKQFMDSVLDDLLKGTFNSRLLNPSSVSESTESGAEKTVEQFLESETADMLKGIVNYFYTANEEMAKHFHETYVSESDTTPITLEEQKRFRELIEIERAKVVEQFFPYIKSEIRRRDARVEEFKKSKAE